MGIPEFHFAAIAMEGVGVVKIEKPVLNLGWNLIEQVFSIIERQVVEDAIALVQKVVSAVSEGRECLDYWVNMSYIEYCKFKLLVSSILKWLIFFVVFISAVVDSVGVGERDLVNRSVILLVTGMFLW